jgi:peptide/nickel transport system substrate-binding protein
VKTSVYRLLCAALLVAMVLPACAAPATPTPAPAKPAATTAPAAATSAPAAATGAPAAATKPAAAAATAAPAVKVKRGGTLRTAVTNEWMNMWGAISTGPTPYMLYDPIVAWRPDDKGVWGPAPALAESWEVKGKEITFKLRKGVKFHDGTDWNAKSALWNLEQETINKKSVTLVAIDQVDPKGFQIIDDYTLKVTLLYPSASFVPGIADTRVFSLMISQTAMDKLGEDKFQDAPAGTGPFQFVDWKRNNALTLKKNPNYWKMGADGQPLPYLDGISYRFIVDDSVRLLELKSGNIDVLEFIQGKDVPGVKSNPELAYIESDVVGLHRDFFFNAQNDVWGKNLKLRQAVQYTIDHDALATTLGQGIGKPGKYLLMPGVVGYDETVPFYKQDLAKAKSLLAEAGYPSGIDMDITAHSREVDQRQAQMLQQMFSAIGVRVNLTVIDRLAWGKRVREGNVFEGATRQSGSGSDPDLEMSDLWRAEGRAAYSRENNPELEKCMTDGRSEYDPKKRAEIYKKCQTISYEGAFWSWLWVQTYNYAMNKKLKGWTPCWEANWRLEGVWFE